MKITYLGTTTLLFDDTDTQILFDAHVTRPGLDKIVLNKKLDSNEGLVRQLKYKYEMNRLKGIFISHSHHDHVLDVVNFARNTDAVIYGSSSTLNVARGGGVDEEQMCLFHDGFEVIIGDYKIRVLKSKHSKPNIFNNNLGEEIEEPLVLPCAYKKFKEGGSYDFYIEHHAKRYIIRPSFNYVKGEFDHLNADILFLGIGGMGLANKEMVQEFFNETVEKIKPCIIIPIHHDKFYADFNSSFSMSTKKAITKLESYSIPKNIQINVLKPFDVIEI